MSENKIQLDPEKLSAKKAAVLGSKRSRSPIFLTVALVMVTIAIGVYFGVNMATAGKQSSNADSFVGISELKAQPDLYPGTITIQGVASRVFKEDGVIEVSDEKACCSIYLLTPLNEGQQAKLKVTELYDGNYPAPGSPITVSGALEKGEDGYRFVVAELVQGKHVLLEVK